jgi:hypothetical protein
VSPQEGEGVEIVLRSCELFRCVMIPIPRVFSPPFYIVVKWRNRETALLQLSLRLTLEAQRDISVSTVIVILPSSRH